MNDMTPGRAAPAGRDLLALAAYGARYGSSAADALIPWRSEPEDERDRWRASADAVRLMLASAIEGLEARLAAAKPRPAPELAAAMGEARELRELVTDMLTAFSVTSSGHSARVGQVQIARWRERAGLDA